MAEVHYYLGMNYYHMSMLRSDYQKGQEEKRPRFQQGDQPVVGAAAEDKRGRGKGQDGQAVAVEQPVEESKFDDAFKI